MYQGNSVVLGSKVSGRPASVPVPASSQRLAHPSDSISFVSKLPNPHDQAPEPEGPTIFVTTAPNKPPSKRKMTKNALAMEYQAGMSKSTIPAPPSRQKPPNTRPLSGNSSIMASNVALLNEYVVGGPGVSGAPSKGGQRVLSGPVPPSNVRVMAQVQKAAGEACSD